MQATPPDTIENVVDLAVATAPDSKAPSWGPPSTTAICTEAMRVRRASGTEDWRMVVRNTAEMTSAQPARPSRARAIPSAWTSPKAAMAAPHAHTATMTIRPWWRNRSQPAGGPSPHQGSCRRRGIEQAERASSPVEDGDRECREQRSGCPEHHGVDVDQVATQQDLTPADEPEQLAERTQPGSAPTGHRWHGRHQGHGRSGQHEGDGIDGIDPSELDCSDEDAGQRRTDHHARLVHDLHGGESGDQIGGPAPTRAPPSCRRWSRSRRSRRPLRSPRR